MAHVVGPQHLPGSISVERKEGKVRNFVGANNSPIKHYGAARVRLELEDGRHIQNEFQVADVCRPLHSISTVTDEGFDVLFRKGEGTVVPAGVFDKILAQVKHVCTYPRRGGLYVATVKAKVPRNKDRKPGSPAPFAGQGASR